MEAIREHNQKIEEFGEEINQTLGNFEDKVGDINLNDQDHFFLNKEILRFKTAITSVDSQREIYIDETDTIENNFNLASNSLDIDNVIPISQEDLEKLRQNLKHLKKQVDNDLPKIQKGVDGLEQYVLRSLKNQLYADSKQS